MKGLAFVAVIALVAMCMPNGSQAYSWPEYKGAEEDANVVAIQYLLRYRGYKDQMMTGVYDESTISHIKKYQKTRGLTPNGIADDKTISKLIKSVRSGQENNLGVQAVQYLLKHKHHFDLEVDGDFGKKTRRMLTGFMHNTGKKSHGGSADWRAWLHLFGRKATVCKGKDDASLSPLATHSCDGDWLVVCRKEDAVWRQLCTNGCHEGRCVQKVRPKEYITEDQFRCCFPRLRGSKVVEYHRGLVDAMTSGGIDTVLRQAAFIAQVSHESGGLRWWTERGSLCKRYEGKKTLGNTSKGDGCRFKGRGPIQLTGRGNYRNAGKAIGIDLEADPELVATAQVGFKTSVWFWNRRSLSKYADSQQFDDITYRVNGGFKGKYGRDDEYDQCKKCMEGKLSLFSLANVHVNLLGERPEIPAPVDDVTKVMSYRSEYNGSGEEDSDSDFSESESDIDSSELESSE